MSANGGDPLGEAEYADLVARVQATVAASVPPGSSVLVVSKGDAALLEMPGVNGGALPPGRGGRYAGHHPLDSAAATAAARGAAAARRRIPRDPGDGALVARVLRRVRDTPGRATASSSPTVPDTCLIYGSVGSARRPARARRRRRRRPVDQMRDYLEHLVTGRREAGRPRGGSRGPAAGARALRRRARRAAGGGGRRGAFSAELRAARRRRRRLPGRSQEPRTSGSIGRADLLAEIESTCRKVADQRHLCRVFDLDDDARHR